MADGLDSTLSRVLLKRGVLDPSRLDVVLQYQLVHGGTLDTALLELAMLDLHTLEQTIAEAWQTQLVSDEQWTAKAADAVSLLPVRMATTMRVCPLFLDAVGLHVAVPAPLDRMLIGELASVLGRLVIPHVVPEVRLWRGLSLVYGVRPDERMQALWLSATGQTGTTYPPASARPTPLVDVIDGLSPAPWDLLDALAQLAAQDTRDGVLSVALRFARRALPFAAVFGIRADVTDIEPAKRLAAPTDASAPSLRCYGWRRTGPSEGSLFDHATLPLTPDCVLWRLVHHPAPSVGMPEDTPGNEALLAWLGRRRPQTLMAVPIVVGGRVVAALVGDGGVRARDVAQLSETVSFGARLGPAFEALLRHRKAQHVSLFPTAATPEKKPAPRPITVNMPAVDVAPPKTSADAPAAGSTPATRRSGPLQPAWAAADGTSPFARSYVGPGREDAERSTRPPAPVSDEVRRPPPGKAPSTRNSGVIEAPAALQSFVALDDASANEAWRLALADTVARGHQGGESATTIRPESTPPADIQVAASAVGEVSADAANMDAITIVNPSSPAPDTTLVEEMAHAFQATERTSREGRPASMHLVAVLPPIDAPASDAALVDDLDARVEERVRFAHHQLVERGAAAVPALAARFPGRLLCDPLDPQKPHPAPAQCSALMGVLVELGPAGVEAAMAHLDSRFPVHRYCAVALLAATPDARAIEPLKARLHDAEPRVQAVAVEALLPFVAHPKFANVLGHLRERLNAPTVEARRRAAALLGTFRDVGAVKMLIASMARGPEAGEDARQALRLITLQDLGVREAAWERWWQRAKKLTRVDWLLAGLESSDRALRAVAFDELSALAGDGFGYHPDGDRPTRKRGCQGFSDWWSRRRAS